MNAVSIIGVVLAFGLLFLSLVALCARKGMLPLSRVRSGFGRLPVWEKILLSLFVGGWLVFASEKNDGTNGVNQVEGDTNTVTQVEGGTNQMENGELRIDNAGGGFSILRSPFSILHSNAALPMVTDEDIAQGWRLVSVSSNALMATTFTMPEVATVWEDARDFGAGWGSWKIPFDGWRFTYGDIGWTNGFAWVEGYFRSKFNSRANEIRLLSERLALCPASNWSRYNLAASRAWCATNDVDGLVVTFENAAIGDAPTKIASVQMELFPHTGEVALRYDLANVGDVTYTAGLVVDGTNRFVEVGAGTREVVFQRVHPDDWDMDGLPNTIDDTPREPSPNTGYNQTDAWAMAAFPSNSTEIATMGYTAWAAARAADPNRRLIGISISSPNNTWPVCLTFGDLQVMCDGRQEIVFAIDCGAHYPFSISCGGELEFITLHSDYDDVQPCFAYSYPYERWAGDVVAHLDSPSSGWIGTTAEVTVDDLDGSHFFPNGSKTVTAVVTNCHEDAYIGCTWSGGEGISFSNCHSLETEVSWQMGGGVCDWATNCTTLVTEYVGGYAVTNSYIFSVGSSSEPATDFSLTCESVQFVNEDERRERVYPVVARLLAARNLQAKIVFRSGGDACPALFLDEGATIPYDGEEFPLKLPDSNIWFNECRLFIKSSDVGTGTISATCTVLNRNSHAGEGDGGNADGETTSGDGQEYSDTRTIKVVNPIRKLVTNQRSANGQYINPSRLVVGSNAVLSVEAQGPFLASEVHWNIAGPGQITQTNGWNVTVVPTAESGTVTVEARFNGDAIQPKFVLPIVRERVLDVKVFVVSSPEGDTALVEDDFQNLLKDVNRIFYQVGIRFNLAGYTCIPNSSKYWVLPMQKVERHFWRSDELVASDELKQLLGEYQRMPGYTGSDCIEVYVVGSLVPANIGGLNYPGEGVVIPSTCSAIVLAHELGHALGFLDCYQSKALDENDPSAGDMSIQVDMINASCFQSRPNDWGAETGCGFYPMTDSITTIYAQLLMNGKAVVGGIAGVDIPDGEVWCVTGNAFGATGIGFTPVGASNILPSNEQVYTK